MTDAARPRRSAQSRPSRAADTARTPLEELLADGRFGPEGAELLYRIVRAVVAAHGFPPPPSRGRWDADAVAETAHDFLADERAPTRMAHLAVHAVDAESFDRLVHRMVLNFLRDGGRRTEIGRLMLRLRDVLGRDDEFVAEPADRWRLGSQPSQPSTARPAALVEAASAERDVDVPRWSAQTRRRPPAADAASLQRLCRRVLEAAAGTLPLDDLAHSVAPRLGLAPTPIAQVVDDRDAVDSVTAPQHSDAVLDSMRAAEIFAILNDRERLLLASAGTPVRELRAVIGLGPSQAAELQRRLRAVLAAELQDDESYESVFFHLVDQAKAWAATRGTGQPHMIPRLVDANMIAPNERHWDHPTESELADLIARDLDDVRAGAVADHVQSCGECRLLAGRLAHGLAEIPDVLLPADVAAAPDAVLAAVARADRPKAGPRPGELWRARHRDGGPVTLVWLQALTRSEATVVPVSFDTALADEYTLIVPSDASPLGLPLALHTSLATTIEKRTLRDRLGGLDVASSVETIRAAQVTGARNEGEAVGAPVVSALDERIEFRQALADELAALAPVADAADVDAETGDEWWLLGAGSERAAMLMTMHETVGTSHPHARIAPRPPAAASSEHLSAIALVAELDAFVLVASADRELDAQMQLEAARRVLHTDQLLNAVCIAEPVDPHVAVVIDRRDVVDAIETPTGELRPPRQSRPAAPLGDALTKFLDATISPFGRLAGTVVDAHAIDPRDLAVDVSAEAVRAVAAAARGYKVEGKRPGYERVTRHQASITRLIEAALGSPDVDVAAMMEEHE